MKYAAISASSSGNTTMVAAVPERRIRVLSYTVVADSAVVVKWKSGSTDISGDMSLAANGGMSPNSSGLSPAGFVGLFETGIGEGLILNLSSAVAVGGHLTYVLA